jgi:hypothetical protein
MYVDPHNLMRERAFISKDGKCLSCCTHFKELVPSTNKLNEYPLLSSANCPSCGNLIVLNKNHIISQSFKEHQFKFCPQYDLKNVLENSCRQAPYENNYLNNQKYDQ